MHNIKNNDIKKVCFFGIYDPNYSRTRVLYNAFDDNNYQIFECNADPHKFSGLKKYIELARQHRTIKNEKFDHVIVCFPGQSVVWLGRVLFGRDITFDAFLSLYDSNVSDRKIYSRFHPRAFYDWFLDWSSCLIAKKVLVDTFQHIIYFNKTFFVSKKKLIRFLISADEKTFFPYEKIITPDSFIIHFHGMFIPLQGIRYILDSAYILKNENIQFKILGNGQEFEEMKKYRDKLNLKNVDFLGKIPYTDVPNWIASAHICLGIFGNTNKTKRVIPNKIYEYIAMGKPVITADTPAIRELFTHKENMIFCNLADGNSLAQSILMAKSDPNLLEKIGRTAYATFNEKLRAKILGKQLLLDLNNGKN
jgi:glycosyltransferase involved in cell wall biosynthesis